MGYRLLTAEATPYDNSKSGLGATNVQSAIDELMSRCEMGVQTVTLNNGIGTIDFSDKFSSISACIVMQNYGGYVVQYCKAEGSSVEFKISDLSGNVNSFTYEVSYIVCGVPLT